MARKVKVSAGALNVRLHPHSQRRYAELIEAIYKLKQPAKMRGDRYAIISLLNRSEAASGVYTGVLTTFLKVDFDGPWFNIENMSEATSEEVAEVVIPEQLRPNASQFYFLFDTKSHRFYFQIYTNGRYLTEHSARAIFSGFCDTLKIRQEFGDVKVSIVQDNEALEAMFSLKVIKQIRISILKPNSDIFSDDFEEKIEEHLEKSNSREITITYDAEKGGSIVPTKEIREVSKIALENGKVEVSGRSDVGAVTQSTQDHPKQYQGKFDPDAMTEEAAFRSVIPPTSTPLQQ